MKRFIFYLSCFLSTIVTVVAFVLEIMVFIMPEHLGPIALSSMWDRLLWSIGFTGFTLLFGGILLKLIYEDEDGDEMEEIGRICMICVILCFGLLLIATSFVGITVSSFL